MNEFVLPPPFVHRYQTLTQLRQSLVRHVFTCYRMSYPSDSTRTSSSHRQSPFARHDVFLLRRSIDRIASHRRAVVTAATPSPIPLKRLNAPPFAIVPALPPFLPHETFV